MQTTSIRTHELKSWPEFFTKIISGEKLHELRRADDRQFSVGDYLCLREYDNNTGQYTGREAQAQIKYITDTVSPCAYSQEALDSKFCILSIKVTDK